MRALAIAGCGVVGVTASGCVSTEDESAKIAREGQHIAAVSQVSLSLGAANRSARVSNVSLLSGEGRTAVALQVTSTGTRAQAAVPVLVKVSDSHGKVLYSNATGGLEPSLQRIAEVPAHGSVWWVDDQVLSSQPGVAASARLGTGTPARAIAALSVAGVHQTQTGGQNVVAGSLRNGSSTALERVPVYAVALRAGHPVAAGRAVVESVGAGQTASFEIFMVGNSAGAQLAVSALAPGR